MSLPIRRGHYTYREILVYLEEAQYMSRQQLFAARRSCLHAKMRGEITGEQCLAEAHLINLAVDLKAFANDGEDQPQADLPIAGARQQVHRVRMDDTHFYRREEQSSRDFDEWILEKDDEQYLVTACAEGRTPAEIVVERMGDDS
jgi:hypothetical protein